MVYRHAIDATTYVFTDLRDLLAKATPPRSGDRLAGIAADSAEQMIAARIALADVPLKQFLHETIVAYEDDEITRLIIETHDTSAFAAISSLTVGAFRDWLLSDAATSDVLKRLSRGVTPEMAAAVSKLMRTQDLILVAKKCQVTSAFRNTIGLRGRMSVRLQPNHPFDDAKGITASILDGIMLGSGDACIGINPASDDHARIDRSGLAGRSGVSVDCGNAGRQPELWRRSRNSETSPSGGTFAAARRRRQQCDVFRDRAGLGAFGQRPSRRRPANLRSARLRGCARFRSLAGQ